MTVDKIEIFVTVLNVINEGDGLYSNGNNQKPYYV